MSAPQLQFAFAQPIEPCIAPEILVRARWLDLPPGTRFCQFLGPKQLLGEKINDEEFYWHCPRRGTRRIKKDFIVVPKEKVFVQIAGQKEPTDLTQK
jgi:hypothetical protein